MDSATDRPNVLLIMADQHRWDCTGFNGNRQIQTPHLDALAADGVNYPNTICPFPVCTPSRYSLVSGLYVHQHGGWNNHCTLDAAIGDGERTALILVGRALSATDFDESRLYAGDYDRRFRPVGTDPRFPE